MTDQLMWRICRWREFQRYKDRRPRWFSVYTTLRDDLDKNAIEAGFDLITDAELGQIISLMSITAQHDDPEKSPDNAPWMPWRPEWVAKRAGMDTPPDLDRLVTIGIIECNRIRKPCNSGVTEKKILCASEEVQEVQEVEEVQEEDICAEPLRDSTPVVIEIILNDKSMHGVTQEDFYRYQELYPACDTMQVLRTIAGWNEANPRKRKTARGIKAHITSWFNTEQNKGGGHRGRLGGDGSPPIIRDDKARIESLEREARIAYDCEVDMMGENARPLEHFRKEAGLETLA